MCCVNSASDDECESYDCEVVSALTVSMGEKRARHANLCE